MKRKLLIGLALLLIFIGINVAFINNLKNLPYANYYILLLAINIDLLALVVVTSIVLRKLIKVYLGRRRNILRRKLANILFLYLFIPLLLLNVVSIVVVLQSTKTYLSSKTRALSASAERVYKNLYESELSRIERFKSISYALLRANQFDELNRIKEIESIIRVPKCDFDVSEGEFNYTLCIKLDDAGYKVVVSKDLSLIRDVSEFGELALDVRAFVKTRDIITGIFVFFIVLVSLITLLATVWLSMLVARHISEPIERLSDKAMRIARGNLDVEVTEEKTGDEIEELSRAFIKMKGNLKRIYEELRRERDLLGRLLDTLPVGVLFVSSKGEMRSNSTFVELFGKDIDIEETLKRIREDKNFRLEHIKGIDGDIYLVEDISSIVLAERFKTWQEAVKRIAHEIKNPLTPIKLNLERLNKYAQRGDFSDEKFVELTKLILKEIDRISELINQFKHLSPSRELKLEEVSLKNLLLDVQKLYASAGINIKVNGEKRVKGDVALLKEVFYNLINNSLEWGADEITINIREDSLDYIDNGKGIPQEETENVFIPYYSSNPKGMGLGLAVVKKVIEDHGWSIRTLPSEKGAHFLIEFKSRN
ncbi:two-component system nitrogen regulation sensor histidine kinase NtrY [Hydrogenivirga caldilitoris]|uniref:histidine kinase n=1 Tax=Hydrogenivirga caldilitoris TaxID=246264 RepID=A0A497XMW9_9AQUI|nr:ATP-binding protein [Hydrogenivirga caldilitoris]RLJ70198.1 two-component system nitrogen regulation sensor histidine kinase NtrY [Hydrogenivirga caldilitoris]